MKDYFKQMFALTRKQHIIFRKLVRKFFCKITLASERIMSDSSLVQKKKKHGGGRTDTRNVRRKRKGSAQANSVPGYKSLRSALPDQKV